MRSKIDQELELLEKVLAFKADPYGFVHYAYPWGDVLPALRAADLLLINLECVLTPRLERWRDGEEKAFYFRAEPAVVETLRLAGVDFASLANNHACDFGVEGMLDTVRILATEKMAHDPTTALALGRNAW